MKPDKIKILDEEILSFKKQIKELRRKISLYERFKKHPEKISIDCEYIIYNGDNK